MKPASTFDIACAVIAVYGPLVIFEMCRTGWVF